MEGIDKIYTLFANFVQASNNVGENGYDEDALKAQNTELFNAYWAFVRVKNIEVKEVERR